MKRTISLVLISVVLAVAPVLADALRLIRASGTVNLEEIGGNGLRVFSLWDTSGDSRVRPDGSFKTVIADSRPQKISVRDARNMTRALAIVLPQEPHNIRFDAKSTAVAILCGDTALFRTPADVRKLSLLVEGQGAFKDLARFFEKNLPLKSIEEIACDSECTLLLEKCDKEIFGEDPEAIRKTLSVAEGKLQKILQDQ